MARRSGLGKGLGSLIPASAVGDATSVYREIPVSSIQPNSHQPRTVFDEEALAALASSVRELGVLQPVLVRPAGEAGNYELIAGERRWRAAKRAGLATVPALVRPVEEAASLAQALVENVQREDLNPLDEAAAYQQLIEDFQLTHEEVAARVGKSRAAISNALRLFQLPTSVQRLVIDGKLSAGHARALLATPDRNLQEELGRRAAHEGWSVRATEAAARQRARSRPSRPGPTAPSRLRPPGLLELEELLSAHLDTRVKVEMGPPNGRVTIEFADLEDLERLYRRMTSGTVPAQNSHGA